MDAWCPGCRGLVEADMRYCPHCGTDMSPQAGLVAPPQQAWPQHAPVPYQYPLMPMPYPIAHTPWTGGRVAAVAGGILVIIDAALAMLLGTVLVVEWEYAIGTYLIVSSSIAIVGAITVFLAWFPYLGIVGPVMLILGGMWVAMFWAFGAVIIGAIGSILAAVSLVLVLVGWKDLMRRAEMRRRMRAPYMPPVMSPGAPPPPEYGDGPGGPGF